MPPEINLTSRSTLESLGRSIFDFAVLVMFSFFRPTFCESDSDEEQVSLGRRSVKVGLMRSKITRRIGEKAPRKKSGYAVHAEKSANEVRQKL